MTSLAGARRVTSLVDRLGMLKNDDQQLLNPKVMGHTVSTWRSCNQVCYHPARWRNASRFDNGSAIPFDKRPPWVIGRATNRGDIRVSPALTWAELALLRLLTRSSGATALPNYGNPPGAEFGGNPYARGRKNRGKLATVVKAGKAAAGEVKATVAPAGAASSTGG